MIKVCEICGKNFECDKHSERRTCSTKCRSELRKRTKEWKAQLTQPYESETIDSNDDIGQLQTSVESIYVPSNDVDLIDLDNIITCTGVNVKNAYERIIYDYLVETGQNFMYNFPIEFEYSGNIQLTYISFNVCGKYIDVQADESLLKPIYKTCYLPFDMILQVYKQHDVFVMANEELIPLLQAEGIKSISINKVILDNILNIDISLN